METTEPNTRKVRKASTAEIIAIHKMLDEHLRKNHEGQWLFEEGWSDAKIAAEIDPTHELQAGAVSRVRLEMFGALKPVSPPTSAEIEEVKRRLVSVELRLDRLEGKLPLSQAA